MTTELKQRIVTAVVLVVLLIGAVLYSPRTTAIFFAVITLIAAFEWAGFFTRARVWRIAYVLISGLLLLFCYRLTDGVSIYYLKVLPTLLLILVCLFWFAILLFIVGVQRYGLPRRINPAVLWVIGWLMLLPTFQLLVLLRQSEGGTKLIGLLFLIIMVADSAAYFGGRAFGRRKLADKISPGKSWAGFWCALIVSPLLTLLLLKANNYLFISDAEIDLVPLLIFFVSIALVVLFSIVGDLFESLFKRLYDVKDSGKLLPGHGGFLDRIDSLLAATPIFVLATMALINYLKNLNS